MSHEVNVNKHLAAHQTYLAITESIHEASHEQDVAHKVQYRRQERQDQIQKAEANQKELPLTLKSDVRTAPALPLSASKKSDERDPFAANGEGSRVMLTMLQAGQAMLKISSLGWQTFFKQQSEMMQQGQEFTKVIADATVNAYQKQSEATQNDASKELNNGLISLAAGVFILGAGGYKAYKAIKAESEEVALVEKGASNEASESAKRLREAEEKLQAAEDAQKTPPADAKPADLQKAVDDAEKVKETAKLENEAAQAQDKLVKAKEGKDEAAKQLAKKEYSEAYQKLKENLGKKPMPSFFKRAGEILPNAGKSLRTYITEGLHHANQSVTMAQVYMASGTAFNSYTYDTKKAVCQAAEGQFHALRSTAENNASLYGQMGTRAGELAGAQQNQADQVDNRTNSGMESISGSFISMFRG